MRLLLDTQIVLWALARSTRLSAERYEDVTDPGNDVFVSAVSPWEIEIKRQSGKLRAPADILDALRRAEFTALPVSAQHGVAAGRLPLHHGDPFDRMLVAQAQLERLTLVTRDPRLAAYGIATLAA
jgi:PIN domain nuclease of toxin-antitoxin system